MTTPAALSFELTLDREPVTVIVSDTTLQASFAHPAGAVTGMQQIYGLHRAAIHAAAMRRASASRSRTVVLRAADFG